jgi:hypothetical protein
MALIAYIDGWPLYSSYQEALIDAKARGCVGGYHSHNLQGVTGYMPCHKHSALVEVSAPLPEEPGGGGPGGPGEPPEFYQYTGGITPGPGGPIVPIEPTTITPTGTAGTGGLPTDIEVLEVERERQREFIASIRDEQILQVEIIEDEEEEEEDLLIRRMGVRMIDTTDASDVSDDKRGDY